MAAILLLAILVSGFITCTRHPEFKIILHKLEGQTLYLHAARLGFTCIFCSLLLVGIISYLFSHRFDVLCVPHDLKNTTYCLYDLDLDYLRKISEWLVSWKVAEGPPQSELYAFFVVISVAAVFLPYPWIAFDTWRIKSWEGLNSDKEARSYYTRLPCEDDMLAFALTEAFARKEPPLISMADRKVYVGFLSELSPSSEVYGPNEEFHSCSIFKWL